MKWLTFRRMSWEWDYNNTGYWIPIGSLLQEDVEPYYRAYRLFSKMMEESPLQVNAF